MGDDRQELPQRLIPFFTSAVRIGSALRIEAQQLATNYGSPTEAQLLVNFAKQLELAVMAHIKQAASPIITPKLVVPS